jgi:hypothetical protein
MLEGRDKSRIECEYQQYCTGRSKVPDRKRILMDFMYSAAETVAWVEAYELWIWMALA